MSTKDKIQVFPSRANAVIMNLKIQAAKRGVALLKRKRDAIDIKLREIRLHMGDKEEQVDNMMRTAIFSVAKANLLGTDFKPVIVADSRVASAFLRKRQMKVVGCTLNSFELEVNDKGAFPLAGLSCGGEQVQTVRRNFQLALQQIVEYASLEYMLRLMLLASRQTNMRVNALDYVVIPRLHGTARYIAGELEEIEREDFYRLKRSQAKQLEAKIAFTELIKTRNMTEAELVEYIKQVGHRGRDVGDVVFDSNLFENQTLEDRLRQAYLTRKSSSSNAPRESKPKPKDEYAIEFLHRKIIRDPRSSKASFISLRSRMSVLQMRASEMSNESE